MLTLITFMKKEDLTKLNSFKFLCIYDFQNYNYLKGYAAVCQLKKDYQKAFDMYHICLMLSPDNDFSLVYYMGQCQMGLKKH